MAKDITYDYDSELDILHVYSEDIKKGVKGCLAIGDFNIDVGKDNKIVGIEVEQASKLLRLNPQILSDLEEVELIIRKSGNGLFMGILAAKGSQKSFANVTTEKIPLTATC